MKSGEIEKTKSYSSLCWCASALSQEAVDKINNSKVSWKLYKYLNIYLLGWGFVIDKDELKKLLFRICLKTYKFIFSDNNSIDVQTDTSSPGDQNLVSQLFQETQKMKWEAKNEINDVTKYKKSKPCISIYCAKITLNTINYLLEGHIQSYFAIRNQWMSTHSVIVPLFPCKNMTYEVLRTKSVDIWHTCFTFFDQTPFLIDVELQAFDRLCALAGII